MNSVCSHFANDKFKMIGSYAPDDISKTGNG